MPPSTRFPYRPVAAALAVACYAAGATANPQGGVVKAGSATITANGSRLDIVQSSQRAVIDWRSFSIGTGGQVNFRQAGAGATLNRVTGPEMSAILGRLTANGTVFLVNPNGILIGPGAKIDVGGLVAATANISNENFMAGRYKFDEVVNRNAVIVNRGEITAHAGGLVALVAPGVENSGVIRAELGRVVLASGNRFTLDLFGDKLVTFAVDDKVAARLTDMDGRPLQAYVNQSGKIEADGGSILIAASAAKAVLDNVINTSGVVRARSFVQRAGEIVLHGGDEGAVRVAGTLDAAGRAAGAMGGSVKVLGADVVLGAASRIEVAGDAGGGTAFVGGGVQGGGGLLRSSRTAIEAGATVNADALTRGNGGTIVAWSDGATRFAGALSARGGAAGGDGGFVEVSGKRELAFAGSVDAGAPAGRGGRLLLDPEFLIVDAATATGTANTLRSGTRVDLDATNTIEVREPIDGRGGASGAPLTLTAGNRIVVDNDIVTNDGEVVLRAGAGGITMGLGSAGSVTGGNGTVVYTGSAPIALTAAGDVAAQHLSTSGAVSIETTSPGRTITIGGQILAGDRVLVGAPGLKASTSIRLRHDVLAENADVDFNGRTWVDPVMQPGAANVSYSDLFRLSTPRYYENPLVQVAVQTTGTGSVRFNGDVLWGGAADEKALPQVRYIYNVLAPPPFDVRIPAQVEALRDGRSPAATGYFGLNVGVERGRVEFLGNLGMYTAEGVQKFVEAPRNTLTRTDVPTVLSVAVDMWSFSRDAGTADIVLGAGSQATVGRFRIRNPGSANPDYDSIDVAGASTVFAGAARFIEVPIAGNMPNLRVSSGGPNLVAPSPRNVTRPASLAAAVPLPEIPIVPDAPGAPATPTARAGAPALDAPAPDAGSVVRATLLDDPARGGTLRSAGPGTAPDVFEAAAPIAPFAGESPPAADPEYFSQGAFDFVQSLARRTDAPR